MAFCNDFNDFKGSSDRDERKNMNQTGRDRGGDKNERKSRNLELVIRSHKGQGLIFHWWTF